MKTFWTFFWVIWLAMLVIGDPIASWYGHYLKEGDTFTDTHMLVLHINYGLRVAILSWLAYHFLVQHRLS